MASNENNSVSAGTFAQLYLSFTPATGNLALYFLSKARAPEISLGILLGVRCLNLTL